MIVQSIALVVSFAALAVYLRFSFALRPIPSGSWFLMLGLLLNALQKVTITRESELWHLLDGSVLPLAESFCYLTFGIMWMYKRRIAIQTVKTKLEGDAA